MLLEYKAPKRYLVTGGCGFIGSHLTDALIDMGHDVVVLDNLSTGKRDNANPKAHVIIGDTTDYYTVAEALHGVHGCFHLAAIASVQKSNEEWADTHKVNITSTVNIFQAVSRMETKIPVVYTSSAAVYGDCPVAPISEDVPPCPLTAYGADKLACDLHGRVAKHVHGIRNIGLRPFNVYGPRQDPSSPYSGVISIFMDKLQGGLPVTIFGDGEQVRDFVYVADAVRTFVTAMEHLEQSEQPLHEVVNLCTGRATSIKKLAETIEQVSGRSLLRQYAPARVGDIRVSIGHTGKLARLLDLSLDTTLEKGLATMLRPKADQALMA